MGEVKVILGIDPGSTFTGFGIVNSDDGQILHVTHGVIAPPGSLSFHERLGIIAGELEALVARVNPDQIVIERIFLGKNADSAFKLGHVRGVAVACGMRAGSEVFEYAARAVKKGITGSGAASKEQVQLVLFAALGLQNHRARFDASDALALAFYHARNLQVAARFAGTGALGGRGRPPKDGFGGDAEDGFGGNAEDEFGGNAEDGADL